MDTRGADVRQELHRQVCDGSLSHGQLHTTTSKNRAFTYFRITDRYTDRTYTAHDHGTGKEAKRIVIIYE